MVYYSTVVKTDYITFFDIICYFTKVYLMNFPLLRLRTSILHFSLYESLAINEV